MSLRDGAMAKPDPPPPPQTGAKVSTVVRSVQHRRAVPLAGVANAPARPLVARSWERCVAVGLTREGMRLPPVPLQQHELAEYRDTHPLMLTLPICRDLLGEVVQDSGCVFAIADASGALLWVEGHSKTRHVVEQIHFMEGADWSERAAGTNAPGTALTVGGPVRIIGEEHFNGAVHPWSCAAAPIRDPDSGQLLGVLDVTGGDPAASRPMLALIRATTRAIETELARRLAVSDLSAYLAQGPRQPRLAGGAALVSPGGRILAATSRLGLTRLSGVTDAGDGSSLLPDGRRLVIEPVGASGYVVVRFVETSDQRDPTSPVRLSVLGRDTALLEIDGRVVKLGPRHSEIMVLLALADDGLTTERLAAGLSSGALNSTTVRVDMSRLRTRLGGDLLASRPYLLRRPIRSDLDVVQDLLAEGRASDALSAYPGPLLPHSQAPGIAERRQALHRQLREAVVASYDARLLGRWLEAPWGMDDASAWEALAGLLPEGSPRRSQAGARAEALRRPEGSAIFLKLKT
jgi:hypothetical protein